ncbi:MATE family efflux transporter [Myroides indicus]|uniref:Multidrug-efflux transporter n=1 Tax=Myroides indicus TaxID=1323422 RepID=A0A4R7EQ65_9FLAO|nr:MATE family efflux transporter [Myroides indicus]TDS54568.1 putative MATE family efflux protein [Myroides indicus]
MIYKITFRDINKLAIPAIFSGISESIISLTDIAIVGNIKENSVEALAAVGLVGSFLSAVIWIVAQTKTSISATVSHHLGAQRIFAVKTLVPQAILFNFILSLLLFFSTTFFVHEIFTAYNAEGLILVYAKEYYLIRAWGFPLTLITFALYGVFRGLQNTIWAMKCSLTGALLNVVLDIILVYGIDGIIPPLHVKGAAYASIISQTVMLGMAFYYFFTKTPFNLKIRKKINPSLKPLIIMSFNFIIRTATLNLAIYLANAYAADYGKNYIAAQSILMNIWLFFSFFIDGYASAGNAFSGKLLGEKNYKTMWTMSKDISKYAVVISFILIAICLIFYKHIGLMFNQNPDVNILFTSIFWLVLLMQPINALAYIYDGIFKGMGDAKFLRNNLLFATFCGFIPTLLLLDYFNFKLYSIWIAFAVWMLCRSFPLMYTFKKNYVKN